jgi:AsmA protein
MQSSGTHPDKATTDTVCYPTQLAGHREGIMARLVKILLIVLATIIGVGVLASIALFLFFDPNDFRDDISNAVREATGRELVIEGDLGLSVFPWLAVEIGETRLGNAQGFGDQPFLSFDEARMSVRLLPLLLRQEVAVGTAKLGGLEVNLAVNAGGVSNWDDLGQASADAAAEQPADAAAAQPATLDIANVSVTNARITYSDAQAGTTTTVSDLNFETGHIAFGQPFDVDAGFTFDTAPNDIGGTLAMRGNFLVDETMSNIRVDGLNISGDLRGMTSEPTDFNFDSRSIQLDTENENVSIGEMDLALLGISMTAMVEPFSYAGDPQPSMSLRVNEFSLKDLMRTLGSEPPVTADANAMQRVSFEGRTAVKPASIALSDLRLQLDDTTMTGTLSLPREADGKLLFDLNVDSIVADNYMAPADPDAAAQEAAGELNTEIPVDLIRALNARGSLRLQQAMFAGMVFENMELGVNSAGGKLRMNPISAEMFDGRYRGDVQIDASTEVPKLSVDEHIEDVQLAALAKAMYDVDNITGTIKGDFVLNGRGVDTNGIVQTLNGNIALALADGEWQGTDIWYQLRRARALLRQETPPEARVPARTEFSDVSLSGTVANGVMESNDLLAELPFLRLTGRGKASFVDGSVDYRLDARVVEKPEFRGQATEEEIKDFTKVVVPIKVSGQLASPSIQPDIEGLAKQRIEQEIKQETDKLKDRLLDKLFKDKQDKEEDGD